MITSRTVCNRRRSRSKNMISTVPAQRLAQAQDTLHRGKHSTAIAPLSIKADSRRRQAHTAIPRSET